MKLTRSEEARLAAIRTWLHEVEAARRAAQQDPMYDKFVNLIKAISPESAINVDTEISSVRWLVNLIDRERRRQ